MRKAGLTEKGGAARIIVAARSALMVADLFSLLAQTASPKGEAEKGTKDSRGVGKGEAERAGTIPRRAGIKIDEVHTHIRLRIRGNRFRKAIL